MKLIETCKYYSDLEGSVNDEEWKEIYQSVRFSNRVLQFVEELKKLGVEEKIISEANNKTNQ